MDFISAGAKGGGSEFGAIEVGIRTGTDRFSAPAPQRNPMSSFAYDSQKGATAQPQGPVLVMPPPQKPDRRQLWLQRFWLVMFVLFCLEVGIILIVLPWTRVWSENSLLLGYPQVRQFFLQNFVRGLISGLGVVDIWMGIAEAVRYRETPDA
jgi:hypothetical protein